MSTQTALVVVGYAVGWMVGAPQLGAAVGALVGTAFADDLPDQFGPRLEDKRVQISTYGAAIPQFFGAYRAAGNVIWSEDLEEVITEEEVGGKGGPTQSTTSYSYFGTFAVLLGFGPVRGIRRMWADAVLIYDGTVTGAPPLDFNLTFYGGTEEQLPDPTIEAALGVGNVPAYRGFSYIVMERMPLERFGNRIPNITVELLAHGEWEVTETEAEAGSASAFRYDAAVQLVDGQVIAVSEPAAGTTRLSLIDPATGEVTLTADTAIDYDANDTFNQQSAMFYVPPTDEVWLAQAPGFGRYSATTLAHLGSVDLASLTGWSAAVGAYNPARSNIIAHRSSSQVGLLTVIPIRLDGLVGDELAGMFLAGGLTTGGSHVFLGTNGLNQFGIFSVNTVGLLQIQTTAASSNAATWDPLRRRYVVVSAQGLWMVADSEDPPIIELTPTPAGMSATSNPQQIQYLPALDAYVVYSSGGGIVTATVIDAETLEVLIEDATSSANGFTEAFPSPDDPGSAFVLGNYQPYGLRYYGTTVGAAVRRLSLLSDLEDEDIDVSELTQRLRGYVVAQVTAARSAVEQLARAFLFEGVEQDDVLYFRRRGGASVATLLADDCGAGIDRSAEFGVSKTRAQEIDLPARLSVTTRDPYTDHQAGTQYAERIAVQAGEQEQHQFAVVMSARETKQLADALIFDRWASRERFSWSTTRKYSRLVPTDPIMLIERRVRVLSRSDEGGVIRFEGVTDDADVVDQVSGGVQGSFPGQGGVGSTTVPTNALLLDMALLRDADDHPGAYVAAYGIAPAWRGGVIYTSADGGSTWNSVVTVPRPGASIGQTTNVLGDWTGGDVFDEANSVNVSFANGAPESYSRASVLAGNGGFAIESTIDDVTYWEVVQARNAVLEDDGSYTFSGLLRGRRGTEFAMGGHAAGDQVVLLSTAGLRDLQISNSLIGVERPYRAVSVGSTIARTAEDDATINAERLETWSPVDLRAARDIATSDITLTWKRRTRLACRFTGSGGINVPLGEASEAYEVEICSDGTFATVVRTITGLTTASAPYSAANQTTDFGSPQSTVYARVFQLSATVGRGHELEAAA